MKLAPALPVVFALALGSASVVAADAPKPADPKKPAAAKAQPAKPATGVEVRNWAKADLNKDNLISPEEMEKYLQDNPGPLRAAK